MCHTSLSCFSRGPSGSDLDSSMLGLKQGSTFLINRLEAGFLRYFLFHYIIHYNPGSTPSTQLVIIFAVQLLSSCSTPPVSDILKNILQWQYSEGVPYPALVSGFLQQDFCSSIRKPLQKVKKCTSYKCACARFIVIVRVYNSCALIYA